MSYRNIPRKCSVCQCCGLCDYEHEIEIGDISGDYNPMAAMFMYREGDRQADERSMKETLELISGKKRGD